MTRTILFSGLLALLGGWSGAWLTHDFQVWTAEGARRLAVLERPVDTPPATLAGPGVEGAALRAWLAGPGRVTIVDLVYTRCVTICTTMGNAFQQLQQALVASPDSAVKLLSISFDPDHDDEARLQRYATRWRADASHWTIATVPDAVQLQRLLTAFQVVVIDDGWGGYEHNAALLIIDGRGRLLRIFDQADAELALNYARALSAGARRE